MSYINKASAMSVCSTNRAYSTMQIIQDLPCAKVVDREQFNTACEAVYDEMYKTEPIGFIEGVLDVMNRVEDKLFGEVEHWQGNGRTITAPKGTFDKIFNDEEGEE